MYNIDKKEIIRTFKLFYTGGSSMKKIRNILAMLMVFVMLVAVMPMNVFADGETAGPANNENTPEVTEIKEVEITATNAEELKAGNNITNPTFAVKDDKATVTLVKWYKGAEVAGEKFEEGSYTYTFTIAPKGKNAKFADNLTVTLNGAAVTATEVAGEKVYKSPALEAKKATTTGDDTDQDKLAKAKEEAKATVNALKNLTPEEKKGFTDRIDAVTEIDKINPIVEEANKKAAENKKALDEAIDKAKKEIENDKTLTEEQKKAAIEAIDKAKTPEEVKKAVEDAKKPKPTPVTTVKVVTIGNGTASVDNEYATKGQTVKVTATPYSGYAVARVYLEYNGITKNINTYYNGYYYDGRYYGRYNDYNKYLYVYENSSYYLRKYDSYREFLRHEYPSHYRYYEDYDYWTDRYDYDWYDRYDNYYYKYLDDFRRKYSDIYDNYEEYLRAIHPNHYYNYRYLDRYDYRYHNYRYGYNTSDTFDMPASNVTVYVEFTDAYPYYYDDYYYYRSRRDRKAEEAKAKAEAAKKEEEEAKAKAEAEKQPQIYENKAVISIGSNVLDKVSKNVHTVHEMDTPAYVNGGRVMLPLRYVAEALGLQVSWVPETKTVIIWDLTQRVEIPVKSNRIIVNGITYTSDVKPEIKSSRTMLPIANIARALGLVDGSDIYWDQYNKQVTLTRKVLSK